MSVGRMIWLSLCSRHGDDSSRCIGPTAHPDCGACQCGEWVNEAEMRYNAERDRQLRPQHYATGGNESEPYPPPPEVLRAYDLGYRAGRKPFVNDRPSVILAYSLVIGVACLWLGSGPLSGVAGAVFGALLGWAIMKRTAQRRMK